MSSPEEESETKRACEIVGETILTASALDHQLNRICRLALSLPESPMVEPLIATIDSARKIELLKAFANNIRSADWKKAILNHVEAVEKVNRARNTAAHSVLSFEDGKAVLHSPAAAKLFKSIDLNTKTMEKVKLSKLEDAIKSARAALGSGATLLENLQRFAAESARRRSAQK